MLICGGRSTYSYSYCSCFHPTLVFFLWCISFTSDTVAVVMRTPLSLPMFILPSYTTLLPSRWFLFFVIFCSFVVNQQTYLLIFLYFPFRKMDWNVFE